MILEEATFEAYGYYSRDLKPHSHKVIICVCDGCNKVRILRNDDYHVLCLSCSLRGEKSTCFGTHFKHSQKAKRKIGNASKGNKYRLGHISSEETRRKISKGNKGKKVAAEVRSKISKTHIGIRPTEESKRKNSKAHSGANNYNWQDGISFEPYCIKFNAAYKRMIRERFGNVCLLCSKTPEENGRALDVHHVNYNKMCGCDDSKCICVPLCHSCHMKTNCKRSYWERLITNKLKETILSYI